MRLDLVEYEIDILYAIGDAAIVGVTIEVVQFVGLQNTREKMSVVPEGIALGQGPVEIDDRGDTFSRDPEIALDDVDQLPVGVAQLQLTKLLCP